MNDMQTSLFLLIVRPSILNPVMHFSTQPLTGEMKCPKNIPLLCAFHSISSIVDATHAPTNHQMIWSTSYYHVTVLVHRSWPHMLFTIAFVHRRQVLLQLHPTWFIAPKPPTCPSRLQLVRQAKSCLDILHLSRMTSCHVSYAISSIITCVSYATYPSHFTSMAWVAHTFVLVD